MTIEAFTPLASLTRSQLEAAETGTLVTASDRLRREYTYAYDYARMHRGERAWRAPTIISFDALLRLDYERALSADPTRARLLSPVAQHALFRSCAPNGVDHITAQFEDAWQTLHSWQITLSEGAFAGSENTRCFAEWANRVTETLAAGNLITSAELPAAGIPTTSGLLHLTGFDVLTRAQQTWLSKAQTLGATVNGLDNLSAQPDLFTAPTETPADVHRTGTALRFNSSTHELTAAIHWAREQLESADPESPTKRIAIIVPDLHAKHATLSRLLNAFLGGSDRNSTLFNLGGGMPLSRHPLVESALRLLNCIHEPKHYTTIDQLLTDPALPSLVTNRRLPEQAAEFLRLAEIPHESATPALLAIIRQVKNWQQNIDSRQTTSQWWRWAASLLRDAGWHTARRDSDGYQATNALLQLLLTQAPHDAAQLSWPEACDLLLSVTAQTLFAPASTPAPVQVLGYLEALELEFDALWVTGMSETEWPAPVVLNPLLPPRELIAAEIPRTTNRKELRFAQDWLARITAAPALLRASFVLEESDADDPPESLNGISPLLADWQGTTPPAQQPFHPSLDFWQAWQQDPLNRPEVNSDTQGPAPDPGQLHKATRRLELQAACPMRGWATHELALEDPTPPHTWPNPQERGLLLHDGLEALFQRIESSLDLDKLDDKQSAQLCHDVAKITVDAKLLRYAASVRALETKRLELAMLAFLAIERGRGEYYVNALEQKISATLGPYRINLRIDRVDDVADGQIVVDYKSTAPTAANLLNERLTAPQIPLYALFLLANNNAVEDIDLKSALVRAGTFAQVQPDEAKYIGLRAPNTAEGVPKKLGDKNDWTPLLADWRQKLIALAQEIATGHALADPVTGACSNCNLRTLCRYHLRYD